MLECRRFAENLFAVALIRSKKGQAVLCDMITLYQQVTEAACYPGLKPNTCLCVAQWRLKINMFIT